MRCRRSLGTVISMERGTILWESDEVFVMVDAQRLEADRATATAIGAATTIGDLRTAELADWGRSLVDTYVDLRQDKDLVADNSAPWELDSVLDSSEVADLVPVPWDAYQVAAWLDRNVIDGHLHLGGGSPAGIDGYAPTDLGLLLAALRDAGWQVEERPGLVEEYWKIIDLVTGHAEL
jgi:hypothetical protein